MDAIRYVTFAESVLHRPKMYTMGGTYEEVIAFLEGYFSGVAGCKNGQHIATRWWTFRDWLTVQIAFLPDPCSRKGIFESFKEKLQPDQDAREELLKYLTRFEEEVMEEAGDHAS